ncbi:hypothetical protein NMG60_11028491 [Bertholletia excelsa]
MSCRQKNSVTRSMGMLRRRLYSRRRPCRAQNKCLRTTLNGGSRRSSSFSDKLEALKSLIPSHDGEIKAEQLFQETADYIVLLKTQVLILQRLIDFYGSDTQKQNENAIS